MSHCHLFDEGIESAIEKLESPDRLQWHDPFDVLRRLGLVEGMTLADLGCGTGFFAIPAAEVVGPTGLVYAVDSEPRLIEVLGRKLLQRSIANLKISAADMMASPIPDRSVDIALLACVYHGVHEKNSLGVEIMRILRATGKLGVIEWKKMDTPRGPPMEDRLTEREARSSLKEIGFRCVLEFEPGPYHYVLLAEPV